MEYLELGWRPGGSKCHRCTWCTSRESCEWFLIRADLSRKGASGRRWESKTSNKQCWFCEMQNATVLENPKWKWMLEILSETAVRTAALQLQYQGSILTLVVVCAEFACYSPWPCVFIKVLQFPVWVRLNRTETWTIPCLPKRRRCTFPWLNLWFVESKWRKSTSCTS